VEVCPTGFEVGQWAFRRPTAKRASVRNAAALAPPENSRIFDWEFEQDGKRFKRSVVGGLIVNDAEATCLAATSGVGLAQIGSYQALPHIKAGRLVPVLTDYIAGRRGHYICYLDRRHLQSRIRVLVDFLCRRIRARDFLFDA
jgi:DNA-binding transcriptional LysR family regulator